MAVEISRRDRRKPEHLDALVDILIGQDDAIIRVFEGLVTNREALALIHGLPPDMFRNIVAGRLLSGPSGAGDRSILMNMAGMPWGECQFFCV